jgi:hypothetical protein
VAVDPRLPLRPGLCLAVRCPCAVTNQVQARRKFAMQQAKARERLAELEQLQRLTVGGVLKIIELSAACMHRGASP